MSDKSNDEKVMPDVFVGNARDWANELVRRECRGPGDYERAPKDIFVSIYVRLQAAYQNECERQMRLLRHEIEIAKAKGLADAPAVVQAEAVVGEGET